MLQTGSLCRRAKPRSADRPFGTVQLWPVGDGFYQAHHTVEDDAGSLESDWSGGGDLGDFRKPRSAWPERTRAFGCVEQVGALPRHSRL